MQNSFGSNATGPPSDGHFDVLTDLHTAEKIPKLSYTKFDPKLTYLIVQSLPLPALVQEVGHTRATCCVTVLHIFIAYRYCVSSLHVFIACLYGTSLLCICIAYLYCTYALHIVIAHICCITSLHIFYCKTWTNKKHHVSH